MEKVTIGIEMDTLQEIIKLLKYSLEPMVPYRRDPLEFSEMAHDVKNANIKKVLSLLPANIVAEVYIENHMI